jgi:hypothetical protein
MFRLISDESSQNLGIEVHKLRHYAFESGLLAGSVVHDSTTRNFGLSVQPNYSYMASIAQERRGKKLSHEFDEARSHTISLGSYPTLDVVGCAVTALEKWYKEVLKVKGAGHRFLVEDGNSQHLVNDDKASDLRLGEAILRARNVQAFAMMRENQPMDYRTVVGKIMPIFLQALGLKEYQLTHDLSKEGTGEVRFILDKVGVFAFHKPQQEGGPAYMERYSYANGNYHRTFAGETKGDVLKKFVFEWLIDAAKELKGLSYRETELDQRMDDMAQDVRRSFIQRSAVEEPPALFHKNPSSLIHASSNVVQLGAFRHS